MFAIIGFEYRNILCVSNKNCTKENKRTIGRKIAIRKAIPCLQSQQWLTFQFQGIRYAHIFFWTQSSRFQLCFIKMNTTYYIILRTAFLHLYLRKPYASANTTPIHSTSWPNKVRKPLWPTLLPIGHYIIYPDLSMPQTNLFGSSSSSRLGRPIEVA